MPTKEIAYTAEAREASKNIKTLIQIPQNEISLLDVKTENRETKGILYVN